MSDCEDAIRAFEARVAKIPGVVRVDARVVTVLRITTVVSDFGFEDRIYGAESETWGEFPDIPFDWHVSKSE